MFLRKKRNKSGSITVQVIDKSNGTWEIKTIGTSRDPNEIARLALQAKQIIKAEPPGQSWLFPSMSQTNCLLKIF